MLLPGPPFQRLLPFPPSADSDSQAVPPAASHGPPAPLASNFPNLVETTEHAKRLTTLEAAVSRLDLRQAALRGLQGDQSAYPRDRRRTRAHHRASVARRGLSRRH